MGYRLSLLEKSPLDEHEDAAGALRRTLELANLQSAGAITGYGWRSIIILTNSRSLRRKS